jgi:hypothetical protein
MSEIAIKKFTDGRTATVVLLTFGRARITVGRDEYTYDDGW